MTVVQSSERLGGGHKMRRFIALLGLIGLTSTAFSQKPPTAPSHVTVNLGWSNWDIDGNENKFRQYATPAHSFSLNSIRFKPSLKFPTSDDVTFTLKGLGEDDYRVEGGLDLLFGRARFNANLSRHRFFDPTFSLVGQSQREIQEGSFKFLLTKDFALSMSYQVDRQDRIFEAPKLPYYQRTRYWDAVAEGKLGEGKLSLSYTDWRYFDRTDIRPDTNVKRVQASYLWEPGRTVGVEGQFARYNISQTARPDSDLESLSLAGYWEITPSTDISVLLRRDKLDLPVVQNAWARERRFGFANLSHRWKGWNFQIGFRQKEIERVRKDHVFVDVPRWRTVDFRLSGRISNRLKLTLRGGTEHLTHPPTMVTTDPRALFWDDRRFAQLKLEGGWRLLNGYLTITHRRWDNDARLVELTTNSLTIGGNWQIHERVSLFAEYAYEAWKAKSEMAQFPTLDNFVPNSRSTTVGLNWHINRRTFLWATFTELVTHNDNPLLLREGNYRYRFLTASLRYQFPAGYELTLTVAPWKYRDRVVDLMDYDATVVMVSGSVRF